jgi:hypothetical protein
VYLTDKFPSQKGLKRGHALSPFLFNFALQHAIWEVKENQAGLKLNGTHQLSAYANDVNIVSENTDNIRKSTEALLDASKKFCLQVKPEKTRIC